MTTFDRLIEGFLRFQASQPPPSRRLIASLCGSIVLLWGILLYATWAHWGDMTVDCGREVYVPWVLSIGQKLYRDVWYPYGPAAPYFNALLYLLFGVNLTVLYWAGALSALVSALLLVMIGARISFILAGWTGAVILLVQGMVPGIVFNFPMPYAYSAVYGFVVTCIFVLFVLEAARSDQWIWMFAAGCAAACGLAIKLEIGGADYAVLGLLVALRALRDKSLCRLMLDVAAILPGVAVCAGLLVWIMPPGGLEFLIQQNWMSFPGTYFMKTYGAMWMGYSGDKAASYRIARATLLSIFTAGAWLTCWFLLARLRKGVLRPLLSGLLPATLLAAVILAEYWQVIPNVTVAGTDFARAIQFLFLPTRTFFDVLGGGVLGVFACWRFGYHPKLVALTLLFMAGGLMGLRSLYYMEPLNYPVFSSGLAILALYLWLRWLSIPFTRPFQRLEVPTQSILIVGMLGAALILNGPQYGQLMRSPSLFRSARGDVFMPDLKAHRYGAAVRFITERAGLGQSVLSVPEDTALYFFAGVTCPTRVYAFAPGVLTPGRITEQTIDEIERKRINYVVWSNRRFIEYGVPEFGRDFDQELGNYLKSHYRPLGPLMPEQGGGWNAVVWQRLDDGQPARK